MEFVTFKIAKKLKEKGFREKCLAYYTPYGEILRFNTINVDIRPSGYEMKFAEFYECYNYYVESNIDAPTISRVLKWLREEKKMHVIIPASFDEGYWWEVRDFNREISEYSDVEYTSYEEATIAGIEYVLDNLI